MPNNEGNHPGAEQHPIPVDRIPAPGPAPTCIPEQVTPHRISTLAFILEYLQPKRVRNSFKINLSNYRFKRLLGIYDDISCLNEDISYYLISWTHKNLFLNYRIILIPRFSCFVG